MNFAQPFDSFTTTGGGGSGGGGSGGNLFEYNTCFKIKTINEKNVSVIYIRFCYNIQLVPHNGQNEVKNLLQLIFFNAQTHNVIFEIT
ncbi:unnamed protein product [Didymodactylos carnosus]|uniref:Uncharacterized protein n=1 Tax=Didymodactylos carnosus TaxID=1234261 RepID=A0A814AMB3_9BILA|nr:unnamed protein product [Didymodactylos carnosus]CAF3696781.1 unnamed protein product [Didymodactylos carnosus]